MQNKVIGSVDYYPDNILANFILSRYGLTAYNKEDIVEAIVDYFNSVSEWLRSHQEFTVVAVCAAILVLGGGYINRGVKRLFSSNHFIIRTVVFILLCSIGYGILATWLNWGIGSLMDHIDKPYYGPAVLLLFIAIGVLAERK